MKPMCTLLCLILVGPHVELLAQQAVPRGVESPVDTSTGSPRSGAWRTTPVDVVDARPPARRHGRWRRVRSLAKMYSSRHESAPSRSPSWLPNDSVVDETAAFAAMGAGVVLLAEAANSSCAGASAPPDCSIVKPTVIGAGIGALIGLGVGLVKER